jgi:hypothetical protein
LVDDPPLRLAETPPQVLRAADVEPQVREELQLLLAHRGLVERRGVLRLPDRDVLLERDADRVAERDRPRRRLLRGERCDPEDDREGCEN